MRARMSPVATLLALCVAFASSAGPGFGRGGGLTCPAGFIGGGLTGGCVPGGPFSTFADATGVGMGSVCSGAAVTDTKGRSVVVTRASVAECYSNDGQTLTQVASGQPRVSSGAVDSAQLGLWQDPLRTNLIINNRDGSQAAWVKTNMTCTRTATGMRNDVNGATHCVATAGNATITQGVVLGATVYGGSVHIRPGTVTGAVSVAIDGATYTNVAPSLIAAKWRRAVPYETAGCTATTGSQCIVVGSLAAVAANPVMSVMIANSGDSVDLDFVQLEVSNNSAGNVTTPIETGGASATRAYELPDIVVSLTGIAQACIAATSVGVNRANRFAAGTLDTGAVGGAGTGSYFAVTGATVFAAAATPNTASSGASLAAGVHRYAAFYDGAVLNACYDGVCGVGVAATWVPPSFTRLRLAGYDTTNDDYAVGGVVKNYQMDITGIGCTR